MAAEAGIFAVLIALHHASRSITLQHPQRMHQAIRFLRRWVAGAEWAAARA
jgi:hypothetical protein